jgi:hypothetical protein
MGFGTGMGLSNIKNYSDSFSITSEVGKSASLKMVIQTRKDGSSAHPEKSSE